ncbi:MAG TPA: hypothetical protein VFQ85_00360 [Mycobacteriales bacterium]|jgi:hypothetical protein|nr:hypothetical protein [Mycobacteriales bacterium]
MSDVRSLLASAAEGGNLAADPMSAVRHRVHRRAARRRGVAAGGTALALGAAGVVAVVTRPDGRDTLAAAPTATASTAALSTEWRANSWWKTHQPRDPQERLFYYLHQHLDRFSPFGVEGDADGETHVVVAIGSDADEEALRPEIEAAAGSTPWRFFRCAQPLAHYDAVAAEVTGTSWPSGARPIQERPSFGRQMGRCEVDVRMSYVGENAADTAYARAHWGSDVVVHHNSGLNT